MSDVPRARDPPSDRVEVVSLPITTSLGNDRRLSDVTQLPFVILQFFRSTHATQSWTRQSNFAPRIDAQEQGKADYASGGILGGDRCHHRLKIARTSDLPSN
jgi:hypothetical protein